MYLILIISTPVSKRRDPNEDLGQVCVCVCVFFILKYDIDLNKD